MAKRRVRVVFEQGEDGGWVALAPDVRGAHTGGRTLAMARRRIPEAIAAMLDVEPDSFEIVEEVRLPEDGLQELVADARRARALADEAQHTAQAATAAAALALAGLMSTRDAGTVLGVSHGWVHQIVSSVSHPLNRFGGVKGLIVFDGDDTLWRVEHLYDEARDRAGELIARAGLDSKAWAEVQREIDVSSVATLGLSRLRFPHSSAAAYEQVAREAGVAIDDTIREAVLDAARSVFRKKAPLMPSVRAVLERLGKTHRLALLTQGDPVVQEKRIDDSGLRPLFDLISVVDRKTSESFEDVLDKLGVPAEASWSVGNSLPSDINPALRLGMSAIWVDAPVWSHERRENVPTDGRFSQVASLRDVLKVVEQHSLVAP